MPNQPSAQLKDCSTLGFKALMVTQFLGAMNDNIFKLVVSLITVHHLVNNDGGTAYLSLGGALFVLPFILFSSYAGYFADRYSKTRLIQVAKGLELIVMAFGLYFLATLNFPGLFVALFFMGFHTALYSPSKQGILPEILSYDYLSKGNGYMQFWLFMAIIFGTAVGGQLVSFSSEHYLIPGITMLVVAVVGFSSSFFITPTSSARAERHKLEMNPFKDIFTILTEIRKTRGLFLALLASSYFWFVAAFAQLNTILYGNQHLGTGDAGTGFLVAAVAIGVGTGSILAGKVSEGKVELGLVPIGAIGMSLFNLCLGFTHEHLLGTLVALFGLGLSGGFFIVPLNAFIQYRSPLESRGRFLGVTNFLSFSGMLFASFVLWLLKDPLDLTAAQLFLTVGIFSIGITAYIVMSLPETLVRCVNWILTHSLYRVKVLGESHIPEKGGALLVSNYSSFVDPSIILAAFERPVRFIMPRTLFKKRFIHLLGRMTNAIPVSLVDPPREMVHALKLANQSIKEGKLVCIFTDSEHERIQQMLSFKKVFEHIMRGVEAPIIPLHIEKSAGDLLFLENGRYAFKIPPKFFSSVEVVSGLPLAASSGVEEVNAAVRSLSRKKISAGNRN